MSLDYLNEKIAKQEERLKQLKVQKQATIAREKAKQKEQDRKDDTRRKILLGSYLLKKMENEENKEKNILFYRFLFDLSLFYSFSPSY